SSTAGSSPKARLQKYAGRAEVKTSRRRSSRSREGESHERPSHSCHHAPAAAGISARPADPGFALCRADRHPGPPRPSHAGHLEGSQPGEDTPVIQALQQAMISLASGVAGRNVSFQPHITYLYGGANYDTLDYFGAAFVGLVVFFLVFVITIVSFLNERSQGTLERLMASPLRRGEIVVGYMLGFTVLALVQAAEVLI